MQEDLEEVSSAQSVAKKRGSVRRSVSFAAELETGKGVSKTSEVIAQITEFPAPIGESSDDKNKQLKVQIQVSDTENPVSSFE